ncbi:MAG: chromosomal replication initiator protein DnaA [Gammaproteobacteria bacterium]|nr:chromosomal replication initiator protein DnaA [Gammaproteobacteria bacterium]
MGVSISSEQLTTWNECLDYLQEVVPSTHFSTWICPLQMQILGETLLLGAPNRIVYEEVNAKYLPIIKEFFEDRFSDKVKKFKAYVVGEHSSVRAKNTVGVLPQALPSKAANTSTMAASGELNPEYTFQNFVIGKSNQFAEAAAEQVALNPGRAYNPLFVYGGVGLGKTHLLHAIGNRIQQDKPGLKVRYLHSERFVTEMVRAIHTNSLDDFKAFYRTIDILMIDDIQFFAGKDRSQEEFFYTFNTLIEANQQIIITSDRFPKDIGGVADRLKSRFGSGLTVAVDPPDLETRVAILLKKAEAMNVELPSDVAFYIAQHVRTNIRELEGALKRVIAHMRFVCRPLSQELARRALKDVVAAQEKMTSLDSILQIVSDRYGVTRDQLLSDSRQKKYAWPRQLAVALCKELSSLSFPEIGKALGGRDHTTVMHACRKVESLRQSDAKIAQEYHDLLRQISH